MPPKPNTPLEKETDESTILNLPQTEGPGSSGAAAIRVEGTDSMEDDNEQNGARKKTGKPGEASQGSDSTDPATGKAPQRRFLTRSGAARRKKQESCLEVAIHQLALDLNPDNLGTHEQFLKQMLRDLEQDHLDYVAKENLDINLEPEKSYLNTFIRKVDKALEKHKARLQVATPFPSAPPWSGHYEQHPPRITQEDMVENLTSASQAGSSWSTMSSRRALLHKIRNTQKLILAKAKAVTTALNHTGIESNPRAISKAGLVWQTIQHIRCDYQAMLEEATETLEDQALENVLKDDEVQWDILNGIEAKLDELSILKVSPEKDIQVVLDTAFREPSQKSNTRIHPSNSG